MGDSPCPVFLKANALPVVFVLRFGLADGDDWGTYQLGKLAVREALHRLMDDRRN